MKIIGFCIVVLLLSCCSFASKPSKKNIETKLISGVFKSMNFSKKNSCGSLDMGFEVIFDKVHYYIGTGEITTKINICLHEVINPFEIDEEKLNNGNVNVRWLLFLRGNNEFVTSEDWFELLLDQNSKEVVCTIRKNSVLSSLHLIASPRTFPEIYNIKLDELSFAKKAYYSRNKCFAIKENVAYRNKGILVEDIILKLNK